MRPAALFIRTVVWFGATGPLIGGAPWNVFIVPIPLSYIFGFIPALLAGTLYACFLIAASRKNRPIHNDIRYGAICGALATTISIVAFVSVIPDGPGFFNPANIFKTNYLPETPIPLMGIIALAPFIWAAMVCMLGAVAGGFCARVMTKRLAKYSANNPLQPIAREDARSG